MTISPWLTFEKLKELQTQIDSLTVGGEPYVSINSTGTLPTATGLNAISIGDDSVANAADGIAIGSNATLDGAGSVVIGADTSITPSGASSCTVIGTRASSAGANTVVLGVDASASSGEGIAIGQNAASNSDQNISIGKDTSGSGICSIAIGTTASTSAAAAIAIGDTASSTAAEAIQLGSGTNSTTQTLQFLDNPIADESGLIGVKKLLETSLFLYVDAAGDDANDGSIGSPFLTVLRALEESCPYRLEEGVILRINIGAGTFAWPDNWDFNLENGIDGKLEIVGQGAGLTTLTSGATQKVIKSSGSRTQSLVNHVFRDLRIDGTGRWSFVSMETTFENCTLAAPIKLEDSSFSVQTATLDYPASFTTAFNVVRANLSINGVLTIANPTNFTGWFAQVTDYSNLTFGATYSLTGAATTGNKWLIRRFSIIQEFAGITQADIPGDVNGIIEPNCQFFGTNLNGPFDDDAAAGAAGLSTGFLYQTTGAGAAPLNAAGIVMVKQ